MIKERYCSSDVCKLLRQKGFKEWCNRCYGISVRHNGEEIDEDEEYELKAEGRGSEIEYVDGGCLYNMNSNNTEFENTYACPTQSVACDWLEEKYNIHIEIHYNRYGDNYTYKIIRGGVELDDIQSYPVIFGFKKDAIEEALKECLTNLI